MEVPGPYFSRFLNAFACSGARMAPMLRSLQNTGRSGTKRTSEHVGHLARDAKNTQKSAQQLPGQGFLLRAHENKVLERSGARFCQVWTSPGRLLGGSWALLGRSWAVLGASWARLGRSWAPLGCSWAPLGRILPLMDAFGLDFGALGVRFRTSQSLISDLSGLDFGALYACVYILHELLHETHLGIHLGFSFPPCSAAVRAQHIRRLP